MAGYKLKTKVSDDIIIDVPLIATYDVDGNEIHTMSASDKAKLDAIKTISNETINIVTNEIFGV